MIPRYYQKPNWYVAMIKAVDDCLPSVIIDQVVYDLTHWCALTNSGYDRDKDTMVQFKALTPHGLPCGVLTRGTLLRELLYPPKKAGKLYQCIRCKGWFANKELNRFKRGELVLTLCDDCLTTLGYQRGN